MLNRHKLIASAVLGTIFATTSLVAAVTNWYPPSTPTHAQPVFLVNPASGAAQPGVGGAISLLPSVLTRPANTTAYAAGQLVASSTTAGSVVVPSFSIATSGAVVTIPRITIATNATTGWNTIPMTITLWSAAPTYSTGDGATYTVATGTASFRAQYACSLTQFGDGAVCSAAPSVGTAPALKPSVGAVLYWDVQIGSAATPISGQTFTVTPEVWN